MPRAYPPIWSNAALFLLLALALLVPSGYTYGAALLLLASLLGVRAWWRHTRDLPAQAWVLYGAFLLLALCWLADGLASTWGGGSAFEKPLKIALTLPCLFYLSQRPPHARWLWHGAVVGALAGLGLALYQIATQHPAYMNDGRTPGFTNAIQFGNLALLLGTLALCGWNGGPQTRSRWWWRLWLGSGFLAGLFASLLSGSRGGWLGLGLVLAVLGLYWLRTGHWRVLSMAAALCVATGWGALQLPRLHLQQRVTMAATEVQEYQRTGNANTSVGARLQMWGFAWDLYKQRPLLGWSQRGYMEQMQLAVQTHRVDPSLAQFNHPHNEILDEAAKRGTVGVLVLWLVYLVPMAVFARLFRQSADPHLRAVCAAGMLLVLAYMGFGLTEAFLPHNSATTIYFYLLTLVWGVAWGLQKPMGLRNSPL